MAKRTVVIDDLTGEEGAKTVTFSLNNRSWTIDLTEASLGKLEKALAPFVEKADLTSRGSTRPASLGRRDAARTSEIRQWARDNGYEVNERGRIPLEIEEAFSAAH